MYIAHIQKTAVPFIKFKARKLRFTKDKRAVFVKSGLLGKRSFP